MPNLEYRLTVFWGTRRIEPIEEREELLECDLGFQKTKYSCRIPVLPQDVTLTWSSCNGTCHLPSMECSTGHGSYQTRVHQFPPNGQFQEIRAHYELARTLAASLILCHGLTYEVDKSDGGQTAKDTCFAVLDLVNCPPPRGVTALGTLHHRYLNFNTRLLLQNVAQRHGPLSLLNKAGIFARLNARRRT